MRALIATVLILTGGFGYVWVAHPEIAQSFLELMKLAFMDVDRSSEIEKLIRDETNAQLKEAAKKRLDNPLWLLGNVFALGMPENALPHKVTKINVMRKSSTEYMGVITFDNGQALGIAIDVTDDKIMWSAR